VGAGARRRLSRHAPARPPIEANILCAAVTVPFEAMDSAAYWRASSPLAESACASI
jgi:hypothetical protein